MKAPLPTRPLSASAVSACLSRNGLRTAAPEDYKREGVKCERSYGGRVRVRADIDLPSLAAERSEEAATILEANGYRLERSAPAVFHVVGRVA